MLVRPHLYFWKNNVKTNPVQNILRMTTLAGALALSLASAGVANATFISSSSNNPLNFSWSFATPNPGSYNLTGTGTLSVSGFNSNLLTVGVTLNNTSPNSGQGGDRLTSFGFGIDPNATGVTFSDAADEGMVDAALDFIPSLATIEVCAFGGNNCQGGSNGGIFAGTSDSFSILLAGTWGNEVDIAPIGFKYQTGNGSFEFTASSTSTTGGPASGTTVPEPGMLALLGIGLLGQALILRQRRRNLQK
jgi:hypothetical protein